MGGMIAYARLGTMNENRIENLVTIGSPFLFGLPGQNFRLWNSGSSLMRFLPVLPTGCIGKTSSYSCISIVPENYFGEMLWYEPNLADGMVRKAERYASNNIAIGVAEQFSNAVETGGLMSYDKSVSYVKNLKNIKVPVMVVGGRRDHLAPPFVIREIYEQLGSQDKSLYIASKMQGTGAEYGHTDLFIGAGSYEDVILPVIRWLNQRNGNQN
jgi:polyhydroxyalkanoate synthase